MLTARLSGHQVMINGHALSPPLSFVAAIPVGPSRGPGGAPAAKRGRTTWTVGGHLMRPPRSRNVAERRATAAPDPPIWRRTRHADMVGAAADEWVICACWCRPVSRRAASGFLPHRGCAPTPRLRGVPRSPGRPRRAGFGRGGAGRAASVYGAALGGVGEAPGLCQGDELLRERPDGVGGVWVSGHPARPPRPAPDIPGS